MISIFQAVSRMQWLNYQKMVVVSSSSSPPTPPPSTAYRVRNYLSFFVKVYHNHGAPAWFSRLSIRLWLRSWSHGSWVQARVGLCADSSEPGACFRFCLSVSLSLSLSYSLSLSVPPPLMCMCSLTLSLKKQKKKLFFNLKVYHNLIFLLCHSGENLPTKRKRILNKHILSCLLKSRLSLSPLTSRHHIVPVAFK